MAQVSNLRHFFFLPSSLPLCKTKTTRFRFLTTLVASSSKRNRNATTPMATEQKVSVGVGFNRKRAEGRDKSDLPKNLQLKVRKLNPINTISYVQTPHKRVMEKVILGKLEWYLTVPTPYVFHLIYFLSELGIMHYATLKYCPSMLAASAVFAARCTLNKTPNWNETLQLYTGYSEEQLMDCARLLVSYHSTVGSGKLKVVFRKYSDPQKGAVAVLPPAKNLLPSAS